MTQNVLQKLNFKFLPFFAQIRHYDVTVGRQILRILNFWLHSWIPRRKISRDINFCEFILNISATLLFFLFFTLFSIYFVNLLVPSGQQSAPPQFFEYLLIFVISHAHTPKWSELGVPRIISAIWPKIGLYILMEVYRNPIVFNGSL